MSVAAFKAHGGDVFGDGQTATLFLSSYIALLIAGPGRFSLDKVIFK
jgi:putative oxidoreductase